MTDNNNSSEEKPTLLSDGSTGHVVHLSSPVVFSGAAALNGKLWLLARGLPYMHLRDSRTGALISKVDLLEEGVAIAAVGARIWVSTVGNKLYVFDSNATLLGTMQPTGLPLVRRFFVLGPDWLLTCGAGKDVTQWDTTQFSTLRTYFGRIAGEEVLSVCAADDHQQGGIVVATTHAVRLFSQDGTVLSESLQKLSFGLLILPSFLSSSLILLQPSLVFLVLLVVSIAIAKQSTSLAFVKSLNRPSVVSAHLTVKV
jgi:hypothetical protein